MSAKKEDLIKNKIKFSRMYEIYKNLLTTKQQECIEDYYNNDLSLSEIAQNNNVTRQGVRDIIKKAEKKLEELEEKLKIMQKEKEQKEILEKVIVQIQEIKTKNVDEEIKKQLKKIEKMLLQRNEG